MAAICSKGLRVNNSRRRDCDVRGLSELPAIKSDTAGEGSDEEGRKEGVKRGVETRVEGDRPPDRTHTCVHVPFARAVPIRHDGDSSACGKEEFAPGENLHANSVANPGRAANGAARQSVLRSRGRN